MVIVNVGKVVLILEMVDVIRKCIGMLLLLRMLLLEVLKLYVF